MFLNNKKGVSQIVGFVLTFGIISMMVVATAYTTSTIIENRTTTAARIQAQAVANQVADAIMDCVAVKQSFPDAEYSRTIDVPTDVADKSYSIEVTDEMVYVNSTDGVVREKSTNYKQEELCVGISGKANTGTGKITVYCNKSNYVHELDFGTSASPGERGYTRMSNFSSTMDWWNTSWHYRAPIRIFNPHNQSFDYHPVRVVLSPTVFDYSSANRNASDIRFINETGKKLSYWIESWDPYGKSVVWVNVTNLIENSSAMIYMYYGCPSAKDESNGNRVFAFFDDFTDTSTTLTKWDMWDAAGGGIVITDDFFIKVTNGSAIVTNNSQFYNGSLVAKVRTLEVNGVRGGNIFARCQNKNKCPYEHAYAFSSGDFFDATLNLAILHDNSRVINYFSQCIPMGSGWYYLTFNLSGKNLETSRYDPASDYRFSVKCNDTNYTNKGYFGIYAPSADEYTPKGYVVHCDWIRFQKNARSGFDVTVYAPDCRDYYWHNYMDLRGWSYGGAPNALRTDFIDSISSSSASFTVNLSNGIYSVVVTMYSDCEQANITAEGKPMVSGLTGDGEFEQRWFSVNVDDGRLDLVFDGDPWGVCGLTIEKGVRGVKVGEVYEE